MAEKRVHDLMEQINQRRSHLAEEVWADYTKKVSGWDRSTLAQIMENEAIHLAQLDEETRTSAIGSFEKFIFPMIRAVWPNLVSQELVSVQPMEGPISMLFFLDFNAGTKKGNISKGTALIRAREGMNELGQDYASETVTGESMPDGGTTPGALGFTGTTGIRPNSVSITWSGGVTPQPATDDGGGNIQNSDGSMTATINYSSGVVTVTGAPAGLTPGSFLVQYDYVSEMSDQVPQLDASLTSAPVVSRAEKLRARWSVEVAAQLKAIHGLDAEVELTEALAQQIRFGIDNRIINDLFKVAQAGSVSFDVNPPAGIPYFTHQMALIKTLQSGSNKIFKATRRGFGNWIVAGVDAATIIESHPLFESAGNLNGPGVVFAGTLANRWKVFKNPFLTNAGGLPFGPTNFLIGYKGMNFFDAGYVYAPWIPFYQTPTVVLDDMMFRKGVMTHYARKVVNGLFYCLGTMVNA